MKIPSICLPMVLTFGLALSASHAGIIGTNLPACPLTLNRIAALPPSERSAWRDYLVRSEKQARTDRTSIQRELRRLPTPTPIAPPATNGTRGIFLDREQDWYRSEEAVRVADIIVSFQTPAGGWSKNLDMTAHRRQPGELYAQANLNHYASSADLDLPQDPAWNYVGTFDNGATITQLRYLAKVVTALGPKRSKEYRHSFARGLSYLFASEYPNGGWPQVWPLQGGYHDAITFNDGAMTAILGLLTDVVAAAPDYRFLTRAEYRRATTSLQRGLTCVLGTQVVIHGKPTIWSQQYDPITLQPTSARNYEMAALSSGESAGVMLFLMRQSNPAPNLVTAVRAAAAWFEQNEIRDKAYRRTEAGRLLVDAPGTGPIWSRYYDLVNAQPVFGDRDKSIHDSVAEISRERRDGYAWFTDAPAAALRQFASWSARY